jgi:hypothetical protein
VQKRSTFQLNCKFYTKITFNILTLIISSVIITVHVKSMVFEEDVAFASPCVINRPWFGVVRFWLSFQAVNKDLIHKLTHRIEFNKTNLVFVCLELGFADFHEYMRLRSKKLGCFEYLTSIIINNDPQLTDDCLSYKISPILTICFNYWIQVSNTFDPF